MQMKLTKRALDVLRADERAYVYDTELKGFLAIAHPGGDITFAIQYRPHPGGRGAPRRRLMIGAMGPEWTVDQARKEAGRLLGLVKNGADPAAERMEARSKIKTTIGGLIESYVELYAKPRQRSWQQTAGIFARHVLPVIGERDVAEVGRRDIALVLDAAGRKGPIIANRVHAHLRSFFRWCVGRGHVESNPMAELARPAEETSRERALDDAELAEVWRAAGGLGYPWAELVQLLILTGCRRNEVGGMRWEELDLSGDAPTWRLPADRVKNGREHVIGLPDLAAEMLRAVPRTSDFVFTTTGKTFVSGFGKAKARLDAAVAAARAKAAAETGGELRPMASWTLHDVRRSVASGLARLGFSPSVIEAALNHASGVRGGLHGVYNRYLYQAEVRQALAAWGQHIGALTSGEAPASNVVALRR